MAVWKKLNTFAHSFIAKVSPKSGEHPIRQERGVSEYHIGEKAIARRMIPDKSRGSPTISEHQPKARSHALPEYMAIKVIRI